MFRRSYNVRGMSGTSPELSRMGNDARHKMHSRNTVRTVVPVRVAVAVAVIVAVHVGYSSGIIKCRTCFAPRAFVLSTLPTSPCIFLAGTKESVYLHFDWLFCATRSLNLKTCGVGSLEKKKDRFRRKFYSRPSFLPAISS